MHRSTSNSPSAVRACLSKTVFVQVVIAGPQHRAHCLNRLVLRTRDAATNSSFVMRPCLNASNKTRSLNRLSLSTYEVTDVGDYAMIRRVSS